jgi:hypothetical protein
MANPCKLALYGDLFLVVDDFVDGFEKWNAERYLSTILYLLVGLLSICSI